MFMFIILGKTSTRVVLAPALDMPHNMAIDGSGQVVAYHAISAMPIL